MPAPPADARATALPAWFASQTQCAICLGDFERGDRVRVLPCRHVFHLDEVDEWLITRKKLVRPPPCPLFFFAADAVQCPVCKADVTFGLVASEERRGWGAWWARVRARGVDERTPLLRAAEDAV